VALPVEKLRVPPILKKHPNGDLPLELLVKIKPYGWLYKTAAASWTAMKQAAKKDGVVLKPTSAMDAYRPVTVQRSVFFQRYTTKKLDGRPMRNYNQAVWWLKPGFAPLAAPGTSNHGWGLAVDVWGVGEEDRLDWLLGNHARFGWSWEVQSEPWHIRYVLGDDLPDGVTLPDNTDDTEDET
jgi:LAS superfamily LD-carboxypeptidase LdcB